MKQAQNWLMLLLLAMIWGSSFILMKRALFDSENNELFPPGQVAAMRIFFAGLVLMPISIKYFRKALDKKFWKFFLAVGLFGNTFPAFLFTAAQTHIESSLAGMLNSLVPFFSLIIAVFVFKVKVKAINILGLFIGLGGAVFLLNSSGFSGEEVNYFYALLVVLATVCYAISLNVIKQFLGPVSAVQLTSFALLFVCPLGAGYLVASDFSSRVFAHPEALYGIGATVILAVVGTAGALILFNKLVKDTNTIFASSVTYLIPLFAIAWGLFDGETVSEGQIIACLIMLSGVFLIKNSK